MTGTAATATKGMTASSAGGAGADGTWESIIRVRRGKKGKFVRRRDDEGRGKLGTPSTYRKRYDRIAALLAKNGATDTQIAEFFGITFGCLTNWKIRNKSFGDAITNWNNALTPFVERSLAQRALGVTLEQEKVFYDSARGEVIRVPIKEQLPPDARAAERWLAVKGPKEWSAPQQIDHRIAVRHLSDEELASAVLQAQELLSLTGPREEEETPEETPDKT